MPDEIKQTPQPNNAFKRPRPDDDFKPLYSCTRSPNFWHDEGTIILRVEDTLYRVNRNLLCGHFTVFKDVFTIPQPADPEHLDGCQVMVQSGDRLEDWETALTFMYSPLDLHPWHNHLKMRQLLSLARLAHKYQGDKLLIECINRLKAEFPITLDAFQNLYPPRRPVLIIDGRKPLTNSLHDLIALANNALELEIECILPCTYYLLLMLFKPEDITDPPPGPKGENVTLNPTAQQALFLGHSGIYPALLSSVKRWIVPHTGEWPWWCREEHAFATSHIEDDTELELPECPRNCDAIRSRIIQYLYHEDSKLLLLASCRKGEHYSHIFDSLCDSCRSEELKIRLEYQGLFWVTMPKAFGMGKLWRDLKYY